MVRGSNLRTWQKIILYSTKRPDGLWGPPTLLFNWYRETFQGAERPGREVSHSIPSSAEAKNVWNYTSTLPSPSAFTTWIGNKFILVFYYLCSLRRNSMKILYTLNLSPITTKIKTINIFITVQHTKIFSRDPSNI